MCTKKIIVTSHWSTMLQGVQHSPKDFYSATKEAIATKEIENLKYSHVFWKEGGFISPERMYLRIRRKQHAFDICGAPFGNGFFVSWWLGELPSFCLWMFTLIPGIGEFIEHSFKPITYYKIDTATMFQTLVHDAVLEVVDTMISDKGLKALEPADRKPVMKGFFGL